MSQQFPEAPHPVSVEQPWIKWRRTALVVATVVVIAAVLYIARGALFPFVISIILAAVLYPAVAFLEQRMPGRGRMPGVARIVSILMIYAAFAAVVAGILYVTIPPLYSESQELAKTFPDLYERARSTVEGWSDDITEQIPVELRNQFEDVVAGGGNVLADATQGVVRRSVSGVSNAVTLVIGLAIVPFLLFYILKDREEVVGGVYSMLSPTGRNHARNVVLIVNRVIGSYVRAQLLSATIVGILVFIGLSILGVEYAAMLGLLAGMFALIPINRTIARRRAGPPRHAGKLARSGHLGRPRLRFGTGIGELRYLASHTGWRSPAQPRSDNGHNSPGERDCGVVGCDSRSAPGRRRERRVRLFP